MEMLTKEKRMESTLYGTLSVHQSLQKALLHMPCHLKLTMVLKNIIKIPALRMRS